MLFLILCNILRNRLILYRHLLPSFVIHSSNFAQSSLLPSKVLNIRHLSHGAKIQRCFSKSINLLFPLPSHVFEDVSYHTPDQSGNTPHLWLPALPAFHSLGTVCISVHQTVDRTYLWLSPWVQLQGKRTLLSSGVVSDICRQNNLSSSSFSHRLDRHNLHLGRKFCLLCKSYSYIVDVRSCVPKKNFLPPTFLQRGNVHCL